MLSGHSIFHYASSSVLSAVIKQMCHVSPYCLISLNITCSCNLVPKFSVGDKEAIRVHLIWAGIELCVQDPNSCRDIASKVWLATVEANLAKPVRSNMT